MCQTKTLHIYLNKQGASKNEISKYSLFLPVPLQSIVEIQESVRRSLAEQRLVAPIPMGLLRLGKVAPFLELFHMLPPFVEYQQPNN